MKWLRNFLYVFITLAFISVLIGGYLGFIPLLSPTLNSDTPRDLGVKVDTAAPVILSKKIIVSPKEGEQLSIISQQPSLPLRASPKKEKTSLSISLSSEDISSLVQNWEKDINPIAENFQMKIGKNDVVEISGILSPSKLAQMLSQLNVPELTAYLSALSFLPAKTPFYINGSASILNNTVDLTLNELQIGRMPIPIGEDLIRSLEKKIESEISSANIESLNFHDGVLSIKGEFLSNKYFTIE